MNSGVLPAKADELATKVARHMNGTRRKLPKQDAEVVWLRMANVLPFITRPQHITIRKRPATVRPGIIRGQICMPKAPGHTADKRTNMESKPPKVPAVAVSPAWIPSSNAKSLQKGAVLLVEAGGDTPTLVARNAGVVQVRVLKGMRKTTVAGVVVRRVAHTRARKKAVAKANR